MKRLHFDRRCQGLAVCRFDVASAPVDFLRIGELPVGLRLQARVWKHHHGCGLHHQAQQAQADKAAHCARPVRHLGTNNRVGLGRHRRTVRPVERVKRAGCAIGIAQIWQAEFHWTVDISTTGTVDWRDSSLAVLFSHAGSSRVDSSSLSREVSAWAAA